ncbi:hypothetical protein CERSUDRAFT_65400 [Gelatoporia subvermispora B]|uniref:Transmembrane protein n=1 Tax=Ceriporiopsis subvermispora (strain B) TaxID=914234 RepID=M2RH49_CERS8|nr:hypothetical protein CERSUDRAFT_65400 [Gelatoporia subvermispora B]
MEIQLIWGRKLTSTAVLFHLNRWLMLISVIITFSSIRVYAVSQGNRYLPFVVALLSLVPAGTNIYCGLYRNTLQLATFPSLGKECLDTQNISQAVYIGLGIGTRVCAVLSDIITLIVIWSKTWSTVRMAREHRLRTPLMTMLLRDAFSGLLTLNVLSIVGWLTNVFVFATTFITPLTSIIITHFLLNLRQLAYCVEEDNALVSFVQDEDLDTVCSHVSGLRFGSFVGNMGELLVDGSEHDDVDLAWNGDNVQPDEEHTHTSADIIDDSLHPPVTSVGERSPGDVMENEGPTGGMMDVGTRVV